MNLRRYMTVVPGRPHRLQFAQPPPTKFENDFIINPAVRFWALDIAGNVCTNLDTFAVASVSPAARRLHGQTAPVVAGVATFPQLKMQGNRGTVYTLRFELVVGRCRLTLSNLLLR